MTKRTKAIRHRRKNPMQYNKKTLLQKVFTIGTVQCAIACALLGIFLALIGIYAGFWTALFVAAVGAAGAFIGGVKDKKKFLNRYFAWRPND